MQDYSAPASFKTRRTVSLAYFLSAAVLTNRLPNRKIMSESYWRTSMPTVAARQQARVTVRCWGAWATM